MIPIKDYQSQCQIFLCKLLPRNLLKFIKVTVAFFDEHLQIQLEHPTDSDIMYQLIYFQDVIRVEFVDNQERAILHLKKREVELKLNSSDAQCIQDFLRTRVPQSEFPRLYKKMSTISMLRNGEIVECICKTDGKSYVAKILKNSNFVQREIQINKILTRHPHKNVMSMIEYFKNEVETIFIFPYLRGGTLNHFMSTLSEKAKLQQSQVKKIMKQILKGLNHIHQLGLIHRDIKMDNIMIEEEDDLPIKVKIIDFGLAIMKNEVDDSRERCGTVGYLAPEVIHCEHYSQNCDVFSLAQVFHILLTGNPMYDRNFGSSQILLLTVRGHLKIDKLSIHSDQAIDLLEHMIKPKGERYSVNQCLNHEYFKEQNLQEKVHCLSSLHFNSPFEKEM